MTDLTTKDIITIALSGGALLVSLGALIVSIRLPLYLAKRAEKHARLERAKEKLPPFYRKVTEFAEGFNTPGIGYQIMDVYDLSSEASELGLRHFHATLTDFWKALEKHATTPHDQQGKYNQQNEYEIDPDYAALGKEIQRKLRVIHNMAQRENEQLHEHN